MITTETKGNISLKPIEEMFIEDLAARTVAKVSGEFSDFLKKSRFDEIFENRTGKTKESIGSYRWKSKAPTYVVKAGIGIPGSLNYLAGLYRGQSISRSGKVFSYKTKRNLIDEGWTSWGGDQKIVAIYEKILKNAIFEAEEKIEG